MSNFFDIHWKHLHAECPPDVDEKEWMAFRKDFSDRDNLEIRSASDWLFVVARN